MNVLEKILEEIEEYEKKKCSGESLSAFESGINRGCLEAESIIRSYINKAENGGWIPVSEWLPEDGTYLCTLDGELCGIDEPFTGMCGIENGKWDEEGCVIAWQPLPEPYRPKEGNTMNKDCNSCFGAAGDDCQRCQKAEEDQEKYKTCKHVKEIGQVAVYVYPTCRRATMIKGVLVSSKTRCRTCPHWEGKDAQK